ncbi:hypothetical protein AAFC00_006561 [Neodothiora populina]|uniref:Uncharacterized protein n=1 Tax=Neodothiora populina TaxID=2781224 RepID=A0ABR3PB14_9PEZI
MMDCESAGDDVASKVIRRIEVSKMTRALQNRLALANVKIKHGWENLSIDTIEPQIDQQLNKRKRPISSADSSLSEASSSVSSRFHSINGFVSSPITAPMFSDEVPRSGSNYSNKRPRVADYSRFPASSNQGGRKTRSAAVVQSWKRNHRLPESSPVYHTRHSHFNRSTHVSKLSFISEGTTIPDDALSPEQSEDDDADLPVLSFNVTAASFQQPPHPTNINSSPPQTPPRSRRNLDKSTHISWSRTPRTGDDGADLLMYLATSPTPANTGTAKTRIIPPSTPPSKTTPLPSSMMSTPGGTNGLFGFGFNTPSQNFNFSDFCNVTPSPAQGTWPKTPGTAKTPNAAREARRKLNFDSLLPPSSSPEVTRTSNARKTDLSMELGGVLR